MRQKADKLEKGKWYADIAHYRLEPTFLKFYKYSPQGAIFSDQKNGHSYGRIAQGMMLEGMIGFAGYDKFYLPTPEDIEKYNLNEEEI